jgi:hypothetical protein
MARGCRVVVTNPSDPASPIAFYVATDDPKQAEMAVVPKYHVPGPASYDGQTCIAPELDDMAPGEVKPVDG